MRKAGIDDPNDIARVRALGVIDLPTIQKRANLHFSLTLDLFGSELSTNAANAFNAGLKGRYLEDQIDDDHLLTGATYPVLRLKDGAVTREEVPALSALNMRLRDDYVADAQSGVERWWNRIIERAGIDFRVTLPHVAFNRRIGEFAAIEADPEGNHSQHGGMGATARRIPSRGRRQRVCREPDAPGSRARPVRLVDRPAAHRHRWQAWRFRIREAGVDGASFSRRPRASGGPGQPPRRLPLGFRFRGKDDLDAMPDLLPGENYRSDAPPLAAHRGTQPDLFLRWNHIPAGATAVDVVVFLHGFSQSKGEMHLGEKVERSGMILTGRRRPTLAMLPRGNWIRHYYYDFPALLDGGIDLLIAYGLHRLGEMRGTPGALDRFILGAHSGGGMPAIDIIAKSQAQPDELYIFDGLYGRDPAEGDPLEGIGVVERWLAARFAAEPAQPGALRVPFIERETGSVLPRRRAAGDGTA